jgi:hypothetical protein
MDSMVGVLTRIAHGRPMNYSSANVERIRPSFPNIQTDAGIHTASYPGVIWKNWPPSKAAGQWSLPCFVVNNVWSYTSTAPYTYAAWVLMQLHSRLISHKKQQK